MNNSVKPNRSLFRALLVMKRGRGRPPKNASSSRDSTPPNRTKIGRGNAGTSSHESPSSSRSSTPVSQSSTSTHLSDFKESNGRASREAARRSQRLIKQVIAGDKRQPSSKSKTPKNKTAGNAAGTPSGTPKSSKKKSSKKKKKFEFGESSSEEEAAVDYESPDSDSEDSSDENADNVSDNLSDAESELASEAESEVSSVSSAKRKLIHSRVNRAPSPVWCKEEINVPQLTLPKSSEDLLIESKDVMPALAVYEVLRHFYTQLRLSPFRFEEFCAALISDEQCALLSEAQLALLRAMLREEESSSTTFGAHDQRDSINVQHFLMDGMTWPALVHQYVESDREFRYVLSFLEDESYPFVPVSDKLKVLQFLCDQFIMSNKVREEIISEGAITYDDHCRSCHRLGDLICCETCSAVYHLECVEPPLKAVPEDDWLCSVCKAHQVAGVNDCISDIEKSGLLIRQEPLGMDRHGRKYWFLCRRLFV